MTTNARPRTGFLKTTECFRIGYWNVRTVNQETQPGKLNSVMRTLDKFRIDIAGLSETRLIGFGTLNSETYPILYSGLETRKEAGVGMALSSQAKKCLVDWEPINERILCARFATSQAKLTVIVEYAVDTVDQTKDDFYRVLSNVFAKVHRHDIVTLCGDFNAKVGSDASYSPAILGKHGLGEINDNGVRLIDFCATHELIVGASWNDDSFLANLVRAVDDEIFTQRIEAPSKKLKTEVILDLSEAYDAIVQFKTQTIPITSGKNETLVQEDNTELSGSRKKLFHMPPN
ncbi:hypothetical protein QYM36_014267 [Artemia franciscana]|uniref:Endonuclease/exonuclease/phosphatase domain-containing protein n=1 Tax=Artemia franciscana TaxID=6661 RepID=A0AA88HAX4_ARTSF|nr:hypothetical protein QYM36_014267 [Artemia franciscana]